MLNAAWALAVSASATAVVIAAARGFAMLHTRDWTRSLRQRTNR